MTERERCPADTGKELDHIGREWPPCRLSMSSSPIGEDIEAAVMAGRQASW